jgi:hypothetical protein
MIILTTLTGAAAPGPWFEPRGVMTTVHHEVAPGCFIFITLGAAGLVLSNGTEAVGIPLESLVSLAQHHEPALRPQVSDLAPRPSNLTPP